MKKKAFTLAEMLIVIGIIGVVAALVIPSLIANYQNRVLMTQLKKAYAEISQAGVLAIAQEESGDFPNTKANRNGTFVSDYFKKAKDCGWGQNAYQNCFGEVYKTSDGSNTKISIDRRSHCITAKAGYSLCVTDPYPTGVLDVNGPKGPNVFGRDTFYIMIGNDGNVEAYSADLSKIISNDWSFDN